MIRFIHIKKNGGTSVYKFLRKNNIECLVGPTSNMDKVYNQHKYASNYILENSWKFCVCRNPYTRVISFYNWTVKKPEYSHVSFDDFVTRKFSHGRFTGAWATQLEYILDDKNNCIVDKIFKFENLEDEIKTHFNIDAKFPHLTKSTFDDYKSYYKSNELKKIVFETLKPDFEYFNYTEDF